MSSNDELFLSLYVHPQTKKTSLTIINAYGNVLFAKEYEHQEAKRLIKKCTNQEVI